MSLTVKFDEYQPDWEVQTPGASPVHTLELMKDGKTTIQSAAANKAAKAKFLSDYTGAYSGNATAKARLAAIGDIWTNDYNFDDHSYSRTAKPLIAVGNGAYSLKSFDYDNATVTLDLNSKYKSGPALPSSNQVKQIVFKYVADGTASVQALQNGDINVYQGMPGAAGFATLLTLNKSKKIGLIKSASSAYEHIDLRTGNGAGTTDDYTGPFAASRGTKGKDLRLAFLLAFPRYATMTNQLKPFTSKPGLLNSSFAVPGSKWYNGIVAANTMTDNHSITISGKKYSYNFNVTSAKQQTANEALALKLVKKYYPSAGPGVDTAALHINLIRSSRQMRVENNAVIVSHEANAGFTVSNQTTAGWSGKLSNNEFDAAEFAWVPNSVTQDGTNANYLSDGGNNHSGWYDQSVDDILHTLEGKMTDKQIIAASAKAEALVIANAWSLPMYQWPQVTAFSNSIKGIKANSISPQYAWNYWEWHF
jgi:peptide/nickel transport system substrate-binding protein